MHVPIWLAADAVTTPAFCREEDVPASRSSSTVQPHQLEKKNAPRPHPQFSFRIPSLVLAIISSRLGFISRKTAGAPTPILLLLVDQCLLVRRSRTYGHSGSNHTLHATNRATATTIHTILADPNGPTARSQFACSSSASRHHNTLSCTAQEKIRTHIDRSIDRHDRTRMDDAPSLLFFFFCGSDALRK